MRLSSGVPGFDALVQGGFPSGIAVVIQGPAGREATTFLLQFIAEGLRSGGSALVLVSSISPDRYRQELRDAGVDVDRAIAENRLKFVDWFTYKENPVQDVEEDGPVFRASIDLANVSSAISHAIKTLPKDGGRRAALEILSPALNVYDLPAVYGFAQSAKAKLERARFTSLFVVEKGMLDDRTVSSLHQPFDGVVDIERAREGDEIVRKMAVLSLEGTAAESNYVPLDVGADGILRVSAGSLRARTLLHQAERIKSAPKDPMLWLATARNLRAMGNLEQALRCAEAALKIEADHQEAWRFKAEVLDALGRNDEAKLARARGSLGAASSKNGSAATRFLAVAERRLRRNPRDADALFVRAAVQARAEDLRGAIATLETLADVDETYPGLWVLKTKLHARRGELQKAQESLARRLEVEKRPERPAPEPEPVVSDFCPICATVVGEDERTCPTCGLEFASGRKPAPLPIAETTADASAGSPQAPHPKARPSRRSGQAQLGLTNGLRRDTQRAVGRTNGLASATRTWAQGATNGLRSLRTGMTNGLTNGSGFTNGLGSVRHRQEVRAKRWKVFLIPAVFALLLVAPLMVAEPPRGPYPIMIDGEFSDWSAVPLLASTAPPTVSPNVDLVRFGVADDVDFLAFYFEVVGTALAGGGSPPIMDSFCAFLDVDRNLDTGYVVAGLGADRRIEISGSAGRVQSADVSDWDANRDRHDWNGWIKSTAISAAVRGSRVEAYVDWLALVPTKRAIDVSFHTMSYDGTVDAGEYSASTLAGSLLVVETPVVQETIGGTMVPLVQLELTAAVRDVTYDSLTVALIGTAPAGAVSDVHIVDGASVDLDIRSPVNGEAMFQFPARTLRPGATDTLTIVANTTSATGDTLGAHVDSHEDVRAGSAAVSIVRASAARRVGYLGTIPPNAVVDGGFAEWTNTTTDGTGEPGVPTRIDLVEYAFYLNPQQASAYFRVAGRALDGAIVPASSAQAPVGGPAPIADSDRDRVPDVVDLRPFDFNNDGTDDVASGSDYDADGLLDYPAGADLYLNATIPGTFPAPYAGLPVSVYIGPTVRPVVLGEDVARVLFDADNDTSTGFRVDAIGADYLVEIRGKHGAITSQTLSAFGGASPSAWAWTPLETIPAASDLSRVEFAFDALGRNLANDSRAYFELRDWSGRVDSVGQATYRLDTRGSVGPDPLDIPGNQVFWLGNGDHLTESDCNYNKVASTTQGLGPVRQISLTTGQDACWYADATAGTTIPLGDWETLLDIDTSVPKSAFKDGGSVSVPTPSIGLLDSLATTFPSKDNLVVAVVQFDNTNVAPRTISASDLELRRGTLTTDPLVSENQLLISVPANGAVGDGMFAVLIGKDASAPVSPTYGVFAAASASGLNAEVKIVVINGLASADSVFADGGSVALGGTPTVLLTQATSFPAALPSLPNIIVAAVQLQVTSGQTDIDPPTGFEVRRADASGTTSLLGVQFQMQIRSASGPNGVFALFAAADAAALANPTYDVRAYNADSGATNVEAKLLIFRGLAAEDTDTGSVAIGTSRTPLTPSVSTTFAAGDDVLIGAMQINSVTSSRTYAAGGNDIRLAGAGSGSSNEFAHTIAAPGNGGAATWEAFVRKVTTTSANPSYEGAATAPSTGSNGELKLIAIHVNDSAAEYDVHLEIWNLDTKVADPIGSCLNVMTRGEDVQCPVPTVPQKTLTANQVVRIRVAHSSAGGKVSIDYDNSGTATGNSRATIPQVGIPEFQDVALPVLATILVPIVWRRAHRRRSKRAQGVPG
ncbi:MAG TPA: ATPase domain-containing protein [Thermoplasmata archaeon]|nr:ATPase domain-containing protein [Thermoplasmata archaeon]